MEGWIKIHRSIEEWEWEGDPLMYYFWVRLLIRVNYEDTEWKGIIVPRGSMITSLSNLAHDMHLSVKQVRTYTERLTKRNQIVTQTTNKWTKITICKYDDYQASTETKWQTNGTLDDKQNVNQRATNKEDKKKEYINNSLTAPAHAREEAVVEDWRFISSVRRTLLGNDNDRIAQYKKDVFSKEVRALAEKVGMNDQQQTAFINWFTEHSPGKENIRAEYDVAFDMESRMRSWVERDRARGPKEKSQKSNIDRFEERQKFIDEFFSNGNKQQDAAPEEQW